MEREKIVPRLTGLLERPPNTELKELQTFYKKMSRERRRQMDFLFVKDVPPENNASELAISKVKFKQKISGPFKNQSTAQNLPRSVRSSIRPLKKG